MDALFATTTVGDFLRLWLKTRLADLSLAEASERCGLKSKGFFHDLLNNRRAMTLETLNKVTHGLKITAHLKRHLRILCELQGTTGDRARKLQDALERNRIKAQKVAQALKHDDVPALQEWDRVHAASGTLEDGATFEEISQRSRVPLETVRELSEVLISRGILRRVDEQRVAPLALQNFYSAAEGKKQIPHYLVDVIDQVKTSCRTSLFQTGTSEKLYRSNTFSMNSERYPEFRQKLRDLLEEFAGAAEDPNGDRVARAFLSFEMLD